MLRTTVLSLTALATVGAAVLGGAGIAQAAPAAPTNRAPVGAFGILDSGINFSEPQGSQSVNGDGGECVAVNLSATGSLQLLDGTVTLWTGPNCTGKSRMFSQSEANLDRLGFGHTMSVRIG